jgi:membrane fusion protein (multidrug efflux system)
VQQNQAVKKGQLLFRLDDEPLKIALAQAQAKVGPESRTTPTPAARRCAAPRAPIASANETEHWAERDLARMEDLAAKQLVPRKMLDDARHALAEARMQRDSALAKQSQAAAALGGNPNTPLQQLPEYRAAQAAVEKARFDLAQASVYAPEDGIVGTHDLQVGEYLNPGQVAMPIVATSPVWIEANFKETDLARLRVGQEARVKVDSLPGREVERARGFDRAELRAPSSACCRRRTPAATGSRSCSAFPCASSSPRRRRTRRCCAPA